MIWCTAWYTTWVIDFSFFTVQKHCSFSILTKYNKFAVWGYFGPLSIVFHQDKGEHLWVEKFFFSRVKQKNGESENLNFLGRVARSTRRSSAPFGYVWPYVKKSAGSLSYLHGGVKWRPLVSFESIAKSCVGMRYRQIQCRLHLPDKKVSR